ncbi:MFS transporter [Pseudomonas fluorescens WH6]|nr:MFS transporter [Pseudomonas fluorescens WH6]
MTDVTMTQQHPHCGDTGAVFETDLPARLDRLPWGRFHTLLVFALGITWLLDGLEVTLAGSVSGALKDSPELRMSNVDIGLAGGVYIAGAVLGALLFGWLTDRLGRRRLFFITLWLYIGPLPPRRSRSAWKVSCCFASSPAWASAANTPRSTRRSRSSPRRVIAAGST